MEKVKVTSDTLYKFLMDHDVKLVCLAKYAQLSEASVNVCFKHYPGTNGQPRVFTQSALDKINIALVKIANELRNSILVFNNEMAVTNSRGSSYDATLIGPIKHIGEFINITALTQRLLGWSKKKKDSILVSPTSKVYGNISEADAAVINTEIITISGVFESYEVVLNS